MAMDVAEACYGATQDFPREETFGLKSQIRRSAASIAANIAEGYGRESPGSYAHFLRTAQGSTKELETHLILSMRVKILGVTESEALLSKCDELGRMLRSLIRSIEKIADG